MGTSLVPRNLIGFKVEWLSQKNALLEERIDRMIFAESKNAFSLHDWGSALIGAVTAAWNLLLASIDGKIANVLWKEGSWQRMSHSIRKTIKVTRLTDFWRRCTLLFFFRGTFCQCASYNIKSSLEIYRMWKLNEIYSKPMLEKLVHSNMRMKKTNAAGLKIVEIAGESCILKPSIPALLIFANRSCLSVPHIFSIIECKCLSNSVITFSAHTCSCSFWKSIQFHMTLRILEVKNSRNVCNFTIYFKIIDGELLCKEAL